MFSKSTAIGLTLGISGIAGAAHAGTLTLQVDVPQLQVATYHKPYVAGWIENAQGGHVANLFVWYDVKMRNGEGQKWLKDMRTWWRKSGRSLTVPADGLTSVTRAPGRQTLSFAGNSPALKGLAKGEYKIVVEAAREQGGREVVSVPFTYDPKKASTGAAKGSSELGEVKAAYKP